MSIQEQALTYLKTALNDPSASFRAGQWESIEQLLDKNRVLVVQRTGWGKSMVYFLATKLLREQGVGPTLLISPLLSLMRNQLEAAERIGIIARTMNSTNEDEWEQVERELLQNQVDVLLISPERLANDEFNKKILANLGNNIGLFVIDEAHCISDWGHDFRPDYRRIRRVLQTMPSNTRVLATTATANDRVVEDIKAQLGENITVQRGSLVRKSLRLQNIIMPSQVARMAWLAQTLPRLPGSGIVYTLTQQDAERVAEWLRINQIDAKAYHAGVLGDGEGVSVREELEQQLMDNQIKALVATVALGMGFDKPDLGFVIHFQRPSSVVHYYQQVGRAGRGVDEAYGILLGGTEDEEIGDFFIRNAFPPQKHILEILQALERSDNGLSISELQRILNLSKGKIEKTLKYLFNESPSPITKIDGRWKLTAIAESYEINQEHIDTITAIRCAEQQKMSEYMNHSDCLMSFLQKELDDPAPTDCGKCCNCSPSSPLDTSYDEALAHRARQFLRRSYQRLAPKGRWPAANMFTKSPLSGRMIPQDQRAEEGRALCLWRDDGWGKLVVKGKYQDNRFADELIPACVEMLCAWAPDPAPKWVTCIPSLNHPEPVPDFAGRLARALRLPFIPCIEMAPTSSQQKEMENSYQQAKNLDGVFTITDECLNEPCLLIDDMVKSGWTFAVAAALLRQAGCSAVYPMALALIHPM